jgi:hypothetical protein
MSEEFARVTSGSLSGVRTLTDFSEAIVGSDGLWLTTESWQRLLVYLFESTDLELQVNYSAF